MMQIDLTFQIVQIAKKKWTGGNDKTKFKNIATGETSQAITPFHFFDSFNFHH